MLCWSTRQQAWLLCPVPSLAHPPARVLTAASAQQSQSVVSCAQQWSAHLLLPSWTVTYTALPCCCSSVPSCACLPVLQSEPAPGVRSFFSSEGTLSLVEQLLQPPWATATEGVLLLERVLRVECWVEDRQAVCHKQVVARLISACCICSRMCRSA